jgi:archaellum component FlaG (FlaF/FlaG flagellin family)
LARALAAALAGAVLAATAGVPVLAADPAPAAPAPVIPIAHSALLTIDATNTDDGLALHIKHAGNQIPIDGRDVTVSVDGKSQPVTAAPEGTFLLATKDLAGSGERQFDIIVAHDGIREILTAKVVLPKVGTTLDLWRDHKQMAWWVLNIAIVLIAVMAFSRRQSKPAKEEEDD